MLGGTGRLIDSIATCKISLDLVNGKVVCNRADMVADEAQAAVPRWGKVFVVAGVSLAVVVVVIVFVPPLLVPDDVPPSLADVLKMRNDVRGSLLTAIAGVGALLGLYFTWRQLGVTSVSAEVAAANSIQQLRLIREHEVNERLAKAIEQLGHENPSVQIAGVTILELLVKENPRSRDFVAQVLVALVRGLVPLDPANGPAVGSALASRCPVAEWALVALGRTVLKGQRWSKRYRLNMLDLTGANLEGLEFAGADLARTCLDDAYLRDADLTDVWMVHASLRRAEFRGAKMTGARVMGASFAEAQNLSHETAAAMMSDEATRWPDGYGSA